MILMQLFLGVIRLGAVDPGLVIPTGLAVMALFSILSFLINFQLMWGIWLIIDQNFSIGNALKYTRELAKGNALKGFLIFFVLWIILCVWYLLIMVVSSVITVFGGDAFQILGIVIYVILYTLTSLLLIPYFTCLYTIMYLLMSGQHPGVQEEAETEW